jgi:hypothetical protein
VETALSRKLIAGEITDNTRIKIDLKDEQLIFEAKKLAKKEAA